MKIHLFRSLPAIAPWIFALLSALPVSASTTWNGPTWSVSSVIPDNDDVGIVDTRMVNLPNFTKIQSVTVFISLAGGWNGDLYAYLVHDTGFSVLLNRPGLSLSNPYGSGSAGMAISLTDSATTDIHTGIPMNGGLVTGTFQPDGRTADPSVVLNTSPRTAMLSSFTDLDPNGDWTLFVADQSAGDVSTLQSWRLSITAVPEPSSVMLLLFSGAALLIRRRRA